ncbi:hypothetical protein PORCRE_336 [Porphyromonas crevioricanis JCM 15906]|uniref:Uncharacterized protein n=1 Tax=Porphyromonas crevioricanis JCM 15906 TaxID=1305617 RepID=T1CG56_9PORP|nr:hypothetical protein PORCRE_336 [Porphyromonas crevioricanis JCM 15906]GAD07197.1 hypothetical protein PORCAN_816 [Porphyromonas crevioricanis JCM 13913]
MIFIDLYFDNFDKKEKISQLVQLLFVFVVKDHALKVFLGVLP